MAKVYAKHQSLKNLAIYKGWGFVSTNQFTDVKKAHLLDMRKGSNSLVFNVHPNGNEKLFRKYGIRARGSDLNSYFYGITIKGFQFIIENFPDIKNITDIMLRDLFDEVFSEDFDEYEWIKLRRLL